MHASDVLLLLLLAAIFEDDDEDNDDEVEDDDEDNDMKPLTTFSRAKSSNARPMILVGKKIGLFKTVKMYSEIHFNTLKSR